MDGLRYGRSPPRQGSALTLLFLKNDEQKEVGQRPQQQRALLSFAALQDRRALLLGYVKTNVVTLDKLALLWTIETACGGSPSRAPETHPVRLHLL